jgi:manganese-dependent ADP-ribose/CDP-alcohol diphosphatase
MVGILLHQQHRRQTRFGVEFVAGRFHNIILLGLHLALFWLIGSGASSGTTTLAFLHTQNPSAPPPSSCSRYHRRRRDSSPIIQSCIVTKMAEGDVTLQFDNDDDGDIQETKDDDATTRSLNRRQWEGEEVDNDPLSPLLFTVGVIADIQYAPIPDGESYSGTPRFYRHALEVAKHAFRHFEQDKVRLVVNLGDTIDGKCQDLELYGEETLPPNTDPGHYSLDHVLDAISSYQSGPILHTYGNHCLYNLDRRTLQERLGIRFTQEPCGDLVGYYDHVLHDDRVRFVVVDGYDIAMMQRCEVSSQKRKQATQILKERNPNFDDNMNSPEGLDGVDRRFVAFNGSVGPIQLDWLRGSLDEARRLDQRVIILSHQPILPESSSPVCLIWNYDEVLGLLREFSDVVVASFCGHAHRGGYCRDPESGIHFRVFEAALENRPEQTYAMVDVHEDRLVVRGFGNCQSAVYDFDHCQKKERPPLVAIR